MMYRKARCVLAVAIAAAGWMDLRFGQQDPSRPVRDSGAQIEEERILGRLRLIADRIAEMHDIEARVIGLTSLGQKTCQRYPAFAESVFLRAQESIRMAEGAPGGPGEDGSRKFPRPEGKANKSELRRILIPGVATCSPALASRLLANKENESKDAAATNIETAFSLLNENPEVAAEFAVRAVSTSLNETELRSFVVFLLELKRRDARLADELFGVGLNWLSASVSPSSSKLLLLGSYLFTSPLVLEDYPRRWNGITYARVGDVSIVNLTANRPDISTASVRGFLETAVSLLSLPSSNSEEQQVQFAAVITLRPKAQQFAPDLTAFFELALEKLKGKVPLSFRNGASFSHLSSTLEGSYNAMADELERTTDIGRKDEIRLSLAAHALAQGHFVTARKHVDGITDREARATLKELVGFAEASGAIEEGNVEDAFAKSREMSPGLKRSLLFLAIARKAMADQDTHTGLNCADLAWREARWVRESLRMHLLMAVAQVLVSVNQELSVAAMEEAIVAWNKSEKQENAAVGGLSKRRTLGPAAAPKTDVPVNEIDYFYSDGSGFAQLVQVGSRTRVFQLRLAGLEFVDFQASFFETLLKSCTAEEQLDAIFVGIESERERARGLSALGAAYVALASGQTRCGNVDKK